MPDDMFQEAARQRLRDAGWREVGGTIFGLPAWKSPDGRQLLAEPEAIQEVEKQSESPAKPGGDGK
jgi:hypothetical protein